jgi:hypothetical protein
MIADSVFSRIRSADADLSATGLFHLVAAVHENRILLSIRRLHNLMQQHIAEVDEVSEQGERALQPLHRSAHDWYLDKQRHRRMWRSIDICELLRYRVNDLDKPTATDVGGRFFRWQERRKKRSRSAQ